MELDKVIYANNTKLEIENAKLRDMVEKYRSQSERTQEILKKVLKNAADLNGDRDVICELFSIGCKGEEIKALGFDEDDIEYVREVIRAETYLEEQTFEFEPAMVQTRLFA